MAGWLLKKIMAKRVRRRPRRWTKLLGLFLLVACIAWGFLLFWVWPRLPDWVSQEVSRLANGRLTIESIRLRPGALTLHEVCFQAGPDKQPAMSHLRVDIAAVRVGFDLKWGEKPGLNWLRVISVGGLLRLGGSFCEHGKAGFRLDQPGPAGACSRCFEGGRSDHGRAMGALGEPPGDHARGGAGTDRAGVEF